MKNLQEKVRAFAEKHRLEADVEHRLLDVMSEVGELAKEALTSSNYGARAFASTPQLREELGDAFFSLLCVANLTGTDVEQAVEGAMAKYEKRIARAGTPDSAGDRT